MASQTIAHVTNVNNQGASLLAAGDYEAAIAHFSLGLKLLRQNIPGCVTTSNDTSSSSSSSPCLSLDSFMIESCGRGCAMPAVASEYDVGATASEYTYQQAILIPSDATQEGRNCSNLALSAIVIFNMALGHQLLAHHKTTVPPSSQLHQGLILKTIRLYELAFAIYENEATNGDLLYFMAILNNLALAKREQHDKVASEECFQQLLSVLMCVVDTGDFASYPWLYDGFFRNISHLVSPRITSPAA